MSWSRRRWLAIIFTVLVVAGVCSNPVRRSSNDPEARRRSAVDRHIIRYGRSSPAEPTAAEIKEYLHQRNIRRPDSFLRLGRSQTLSAEDLITIIRQYEDDNGMDKRASNANGFIRFGRDPSFIRFGRNIEDERPGYEKNAVLIGNGYQERNGRASDSFLRFGRDSEEMNDTGLDDDEEVSRGQ